MIDSSEIHKLPRPVLAKLPRSSDLAGDGDVRRHTFLAPVPVRARPHERAQAKCNPGHVVAVPVPCPTHLKRRRPPRLRGVTAHRRRTLAVLVGISRSRRRHSPISPRTRLSLHGGLVVNKKPRLLLHAAGEDRDELGWKDELVEAVVVAVLVATEGSRVETLGSDSNFSDLDLNRFVSNENLPFFFPYDLPPVKLVGALAGAVDDVAGPT